MRAGLTSVAAALVVGLASGCVVAPSLSADADARVVDVVATISAWGSVLAQLGGAHVREHSIIANPNADPHDYEPTPADGRTIATARLLLLNGIGYDTWAAKAAAANDDPRRIDLDVGKLVGVKTGGNPHRWYSPTDVTTVADAITAGLKRIDPADAAYFDQQRHEFDAVGLAAYHQLLDEIRTEYAGTPIGASESVVVPLADALGLTVATPASFLDAISEGAEPSAADRATVDAQIASRAITVYVFNRQNGTPDVAAQVSAARAHGIPVVSMTETLTPSTASFQDWQVAQLRDLRSALRQGTGR